MKATVLLTHFNKQECLSNTLYALSLQETSFPLDICILDDHSNIDPLRIVKEFLPEAKYLRTSKNTGTQFSHGYCMEMADKDSDVFIILSSDVIILHRNGIELLCKNLVKRRVTFAEVRNIEISTIMYTAFDGGVRYALQNHWEAGAVYSGIGRKEHWYMFFSAIYREDLETVNYQNNNCDVVVDALFRKNGIYPIYLPDVQGIHQQHGSLIYPCSILKECPYTCYRKNY